MKSKSILFSIALLILLSSCGFLSTNTKADFFSGDVLVDYTWTMSSSEEDTLTITFNETGVYSFEFAYTPQYINDGTNDPEANPLPESFEVTVTKTPKTKILSREALPGYLDITITRGDDSETHSFK